MQRIGIMQGRLVPPGGGTIQCFPREDWAREFELAADAGLDCIEWIYDLYGADVNPIATDPGVERMRELIVEHRRERRFRSAPTTSWTHRCSAPTPTRSAGASRSCSG